jgi:Tol biopolymer transport system component
MTRNTTRVPKTIAKQSVVCIAVAMCWLTAVTHSLGQAPGKIVFESDRSGNSQIYSMNGNGGQVMRLTHGQWNDRNPALSPDGSKIAFVSNQNGYDDIYVMDLDSGKAVQITFGSSGVSPSENPAWSPDGKEIAYEGLTSAGFAIFIVNANGTGNRAITSPGFSVQPSWTPDGSKILFNYYYEIAVMNRDGSGTVVLTSLGGFNEWPHSSPNGKEIVFHSSQSGYYRIYVMQTDGTGVTELTHDNGEDAWPVWSPGGRFIGFQSSRDGNSQIFRMAADGSNVVRLTNNSTNDQFPNWGRVSED